MFERRQRGGTGPLAMTKFAIRTCLRLNFWGIILCSQAAPQHPFGQGVARQQHWIPRILAG